MLYNTQNTVYKGGVNLVIKIYIDTNIFLNMYRSHMKKDIKTLMKLLRDNRSSLVTTSQTMDELSRNRRKIIEELKENLKQAKPQKNILPFTRILDSSDKYLKTNNAYREAIDSTLKELESIAQNKEKDPVHSAVLKIYTSPTILDSNESIFQRAYKRTLIGNPPSSDKYTVCDELIWETLLEYGAKQKNDLVLVSNDGTFHRDNEFLEEEYEKVSGGKLFVCRDIIDGFNIAGLEVPETALFSQQNIKWTNIISSALENLGGSASLNSLYDEVTDMMYFADYGSKHDNKEKESTIRGILQRFCGECESVYNGKVDLFRQVGDGVWELKK